MWARNVAMFVLFRMVTSEPAPDIYSLKFAGYTCGHQRAVVHVEQLGYGRLHDDHNNNIMNHEKESILGAGRTVQGWLHKFTLRPNSWSSDTVGYSFRSSAWGAGGRTYGFHETFQCPNREL